MQNPERETSNFRFTVEAIGIKIYSYVETRDTKLEVLSVNDSEGEQITYVNFQLVDIRSAKLSSAAEPLEEEVIHLDTNHVGTPKFMDAGVLRELFLTELTMFIHNFNANAWADYDKLTEDIKKSIQIDIHQFYQTGAQGEAAVIRILRGKPSLKDFYLFGPSECLRRRIASDNPVHFHLKSRTPPKANGAPAIEIRKSSEPHSPARAANLAQEDPSTKSKSLVNKGFENLRPDGGRRSSLPLFSLTTAQMDKPEDLRSRRSSLATELENLDLTKTGHLAPTNFTAAKSVRFGKAPDKVSEEPTVSDSNLKDTDLIRRPQKAPAYPLPKADNNLFKWIHVPYTYAGWVPHVLMACSVEANNPNLHSQVLQDHLWMSQHNRSRHASPHARFVKTSVKCLFPEDQDHTDGRTTPTSAGNDVQYVVYFPYLHWDSFGLLKKRAKTISDRRNINQVRPTNSTIAEGKSVESKLIWQFLLSDPPLHCRRTLDQYGYPTLRNTSARDGDQIMYKRTKADKDASRDLSTKHHQHHQHHQHAHRPASRPSVFRHKDDDAAKVLMVDQLWLWILDCRTVVTFAASKEKENDGGLSKQGDLLGNLYQNVNGDYADQCNDPFDFAALAILYAVKALLDHTTDLNLQVFRIFEEYISILTEQQTSSFKDFRNTHTSRDPKESDTKVLPRYVDNTDDLDALLELRDIEDELGTLKKLFEEQKAGITEMINHYGGLQKDRDKGRTGAKLLDEALRTIEGYIEQVGSMSKSAGTAQSAFQALLDMKQKQANIVEAHLSREQADNSQEQARSILIFTIFTIIFLPLSFFASVFGINAREWSDQPTNPTLHTIFTYMGSISVAVIAFALFVGFNKFTRRVARNIWRHTAGSMYVWYRQKRGSPPEEEVEWKLPQYSSSDIERLAAMEAAKNSKRLSTISRTYSKMNWDDEAGPRGSSYA